jgi:bifunctional DNA-binding transcriptional regulator/antitoxin component of YhaV-PrlF toxin-antitoxin module
MAPAAAFTSATISKGMPKLSRKNQITIPVKTLQEAGIEQGEALIVRAIGHGRVEIRRRNDVVEEFAGTLSYPPGYLDGLRDEWER